MKKLSKISLDSFRADEISEIDALALIGGSSGTTCNSEGTYSQGKDADWHADDKDGSW
jgi:natural product precursor